MSPPVCVHLDVRNHRDVTKELSLEIPKFGDLASHFAVENINEKVAVVNRPSLTIQSIIIIRRGEESHLTRESDKTGKAIQPTELRSN